ncbi:uncharacterized protein LOC8030159 isoform X2 [Ixodes scapularis]|uniref:uncharacterized protein LOC8030159 isoform X2 n=1 Tax=Ixodes scapularis TaxID=6945 RepID=UPI001C38784B|nr:uncharacterized protein LOC8030159 isoform X2 [Ixodes scapularis]
MCCAEDNAFRWFLLVRLYYGSDFGSSFEYVISLHSMTVKHFVRTTSVILLLGVGSFVCYKLYRQLKQRLRKKRSKKDPSSRNSHIRSWVTNVDPCCPHDCYLESDDESEISETTRRDDSSEEASFGDATEPMRRNGRHEQKCDTNSSCGGLSDIEECWDMGVTSSNPYEPVRFNSHSGNVRFQGCQAPKAASTPLNIGVTVDHRNRNHKPESRHQLQRNSGLKGPKDRQSAGSGDLKTGPNSHNNNNNKSHDDPSLVSDDSVSHDPEGLLDSLSYEGNASSGAATPWAQDTQSLQANFSFGSLTERNRLTEELFSSVRALAEDEETEDGFSPSGMVSDSAIPRLRDQRYLSLESEASDLSIFEQAPLQVPRETFDTIDRIETILHDTKQELLDLDADLVSLRVWRKLPQDHESGATPADDEGALRTADSGSDFGNSLESDCERITKDSSAPSLEWDSACLPRHGAAERRGSGPHDDGTSTLSEISDIEDAKSSGVLDAVRRHSGGSIRMPGSLRQEIQRAMRLESDRWKGRLVRSQTAPVDHTLPESEWACDLSRSATHELFSLSDAFDRIPTVPEENTPSPSSTSASDFTSEFASINVSSPADVASHDTNGNDIVRECPDDESGFSGDSAISIGDRVLIEDYIPEQWRQENNRATENADKSLTGVLSGLSVVSMRRVKHDGYGAIRAAAFQVLASAGSLLSSHRGANAVYQRFHEPASLGKLPWLEQWRFHRMLGPATSSLQQFWECLSCLQDTEDQLNAAANPELFLARRLNEDSMLDARLVEAVKILMLKSALDLFALLQRDSDRPCPVFATVLFSRASSATPRDLLLNHLNRLGREQEVQEAELYLLGYALATTLTVVRPALSGSEDCISRYPEWQVGSWPEVVLVEQDGQYCACAR